MSKTSSKGSKRVQKSGAGTDKQKSKTAGTAAKKSRIVNVFAVDNAAAIGEPSAPVEETSTVGVAEAPASESRPIRHRRSPNVTFIALEKLLSIVEEVGLKADEKKAWLRIDGPNGSRVYLPRRKHVGRVDIAKMSAGTSVKLGDRSFGAVAEQLDMEAPEERVLENFRAVLKHMASLPKVEATGKKARTPKIVVAGTIA